LAVQTHAGRRRYVLVLIVLTALTLATLDKRSGETGPIGTVGRFAHRVVQPFANAADTVFSPVHDWWDGLIHSGHLKSENRTLRHEIAQLEARVRESDTAVLQLQYYRAYFGQGFLDSYNQVGASVVTFDAGNFDHTVTLNRGTEVGIIPDNGVVAPEGLVGVVRKSWRGGAQVQLINDPSFGAAVQINNVFGDAVTQNDGTMRVVFSVNRAPRRTSNRRSATWRSPADARAATSPPASRSAP
jgi:rod shape-determining protein MreC